MIERIRQHCQDDDGRRQVMIDADFADIPRPGIVLWGCVGITAALAAIIGALVWVIT